MDYNQLYQQYSGFTDPFGRRREEEEEDAVGNVRPVTQTIRTDPVTGEQTMTIKGSPQDLSAANPLTPTVSMPGSTAGGFLGNYQDQAPAPAMAPQMAPQMPAQQGGFLGGYEDMAPAPQMPPGAQSRIVPLDESGAAPQQAAPQQAAPQQAAPQQAAPQQAAPQQAAPVAPVAPVMAAPPQAAPSAPVGAVAPTSQPPADSQDYTQRVLAGLRQREGNYNTPPHSASSAQGAYGITAPAYSDIQRSDPYFANRPQGQLTPEEQDRAALVLRGLNQQRLQSQNVEPTEANQQLAHFLGPKGAADYLASGYISPEAAAANGGVEKVRQIAEERLAFGRSLSGQGGPAVASVGREMGMNEPGFGGAGTMPAQPSRTPGVDQVIGMQGNIEQLAAYIGNPNNPKEARDAASLILKSRYKEDEMSRQGQKLVTEAIQNGDWKTLERLMKPTARQKREEEDGVTLSGIAKAFLFSAIGFQSGAKDVVEKMGVGAKWSTTNIGDNEVTARFRTDGSATEGEYITGPRAGQALNRDELRSISGGGVGGKTTKPDAGQIYEKRDANGNVVAKGRLITEYKNNKANTYIDLGGNKRAAFNQAWTPENISTAAAKMDYGLITDLKKKHGANVLDALAAFERQKGPLDSNTRQQFLQLYGAPSAARTAPGTTPAGQQTSGQQPRNQQVDINKPIAQLEDEQGGAKIIITEAAKQVADSATTQNMLNSNNKIVDLITSGDHNIGSLASGTGLLGGGFRGPIAQTIGKQLETRDAKNTNTIMDHVQKLAADGLKALGSNPSTIDLEFWTKFKPTNSSDPEFVKDWITSRSADLKRRIGYAETQTSSGGRAGGAPAVNQVNTDANALNWAKNNPDDPRAKRILELNRK